MISNQIEERNIAIKEKTGNLSKVPSKDKKRIEEQLTEIKMDLGLTDNKEQNELLKSIKP